MPKLESRPVLFGLLGAILASAVALIVGILPFINTPEPFDPSQIKIDRFAVKNTDDCINFAYTKPEPNGFLSTDKLETLTLEDEGKSTAIGNKCENKGPLLNQNMLIDVVINNTSATNIVIDTVDVIRKSAIGLCGGGAGTTAVAGPLQSQAEVKIVLPSIYSASEQLPSWLEDEYAHLVESCIPFSAVRQPLNDPLQIPPNESLRFSVEMSNEPLSDQDAEYTEIEFVPSYVRVRFSIGPGIYVARDFFLDYGGL